ncbi:glycoside hydrolase family 97 protein [Salegentibacter sp. F188]|uniref:Glycoside hydrolase family 97 protein n=1 Tax=Autumnicola patrickiae TaxID=3075591 RepID=A0ABU3E210_9FLAO|nr:glycoside hydrolase family 97 protein [Salegentibacter sp. F188]MDT0690006.1 glycoside hydrolase family 97 protein [Salegentibacter sp. F188]
MLRITKIITLFVFVTVSSSAVLAQKETSFTLASPNSEIQVEVNIGKNITWTVSNRSHQVISPSRIAMTLENGEELGTTPKVRDSEKKEINTTIDAINYKKDIIEDHYNQLILKFNKNYGLIFRAYDSGVAYRFTTNRKKEFTIASEEVNFNFPEDHMIYIPYANDPANDVYQISFENLYQHIPLSEINKDTIAFAPVLVELPNGMKAAITEADLESYPGMFLKAGDNDFSLKGEFAGYPLEEEQGGHNGLQSFVTKRADYIAKTSGSRSFPWRVVIISNEDKELLNNDMIYKLASAPRIDDTSWIEPGKVTWDWWNDWNISGVDFKAGINTETYKYYTDFAAENGIENILLDEGWAPKGEILNTIPDIDLDEIISYAGSKGVGVWLWSGYLPLAQNMDEALATYSEMGVKGLKVDFMNRDDQKMVDFYYEISRKAAEHQLMLDFHGSYKPTGLQRTYPNVVNFEGVRGLENTKWSNTDFPLYDTRVPYIRMLAGPMDYTPGAMINASKDNFRAIHSAPMSQGTRVHQLALYVLYEAPFNMLADNPTNYKDEPESTAFIASVPTTFDETVALDGKVGEYAAIARRKHDIWYVGAITNWDARDLEIDLSFLPEGDYEAVIFKDGVNADKEATDYKREVINVKSGEQLNVHLANGGGWAARIYPAQ